MIAGVFFYLFALVLIASAVMTVTARQPVTAVLFLILAFFNGAGLFLLAGAEFLAFILLIVYVGAVAVLFLFVVMMLDVRPSVDSIPLRYALKKSLPLAASVGGVLMVQIVALAWSWPSVQAAAAAAVPTTENTRVLGRVLYTDYAYPFQVAGLVLLLAMVGAITLTLRRREGVKRQNLWDQLDRRKEDVIEIRKVKSGEGVL